MNIKKLFTKHPSSVNETYWQHFKFAFLFGCGMILFGICCVIHAFFPFLFETVASDYVKKLNNRMDNRKKD